MFSIILGVIIYILSISISFYIGRHFAIIKRSKLLDSDNSDASDIFEDIKADLMRDKTAESPIARIISPSKKKAQELKDLEDMSI